MNLSHIIHEWSFGPYFPSISQPLVCPSRIALPDSINTPLGMNLGYVARDFQPPSVCSPGQSPRPPALTLHPFQPSPSSNTTSPLSRRPTSTPLTDTSKRPSTRSPPKCARSITAGASPASSSSTTSSRSRSRSTRERQPSTSLQFGSLESLVRPKERNHGVLCSRSLKRSRLAASSGGVWTCTGFALRAISRFEREVKRAQKGKRRETAGVLSGRMQA